MKPEEILGVLGLCFQIVTIVCLFKFQKNKGSGGTKQERSLYTRAPKYKAG